MRIGILGGLFPEEIRHDIEINSIGPIQYAADALQWGIVRGLDDHIKDITLINLPYIGSFPLNYKQLIIKSFPFSHRKNASDFNVGFSNLIIYKYLSRYVNSAKYLNSWVSDKKEFLIVYAIHTPFILAALKAKKKNPKLKICLVVPDLPEFMNDKKNIITKLFKYIEQKLLKHSLNKIDAFVLLSKHMREPLNIKDQPWICVEGIYHGAKTPIPLKDESKRIILYSGTLAERYGILKLLNAFNSIAFNNYELWICGDGDAKEQIIKCSISDSRIKYLGQLPREQILAMQTNATVLVNPRTAEGEFTKYSFPSKTIEYLASGTPTILYKLPGIPDEYFNYCFVVNEKSENGLQEAIVLACEKSDSELSQIALKAQEFILSKKNAYQQTKRIINMLQKL